MKHYHPIQISIPQPCSEDWNKMTPQVQGRFCDSCRKCVVDFRGFTDEELYKYFAEHRGAKVCGKFSNAQLNRDISLRYQPASELYKWMMATGIALLLTISQGGDAFAQAPLQTTHAFKLHDSTSELNGFGYFYGSIVDAAWRHPIVNVRVSLYYNNTLLMETYTSKEGIYEFHGVPPGKAVLSVELEGYSKTIIEEVPSIERYPLNMNFMLTKTLSNENASTCTKSYKEFRGVQEHSFTVGNIAPPFPNLRR